MEKRKIATQFNNAASEYDKQRRLFIPCYDDYYGIVQEFLRYNRPEVQSVLDLGAGTGLLSMYVKQIFPNATYRLVDIADKMMELAKIRFADCNNVIYDTRDFSTSFPEGKFDLIISALSIHHLNENEKQSIYRNIHSRLNTKGYFINLDQFNAESASVNEIYTNIWYEFVKRIGISEVELDSWLARRALDKENTISKSIEMIKEAGFCNVECIYQYMKFGVLVAFN